MILKLMVCEIRLIRVETMLKGMKGMLVLLLTTILMRLVMRIMIVRL
jgi:hypothetical protein